MNVPNGARQMMEDCSDHEEFDPRMRKIQPSSSLTAPRWLSSVEDPPLLQKPPLQQRQQMQQDPQRRHQARTGSSFAANPSDFMTDQLFDADDGQLPSRPSSSSQARSHDNGRLADVGLHSVGERLSISGSGAVPRQDLRRYHSTPIPEPANDQMQMRQLSSGSDATSIWSRYDSNPHPPPADDPMQMMLRGVSSSSRLDAEAAAAAQRHSASGSPYRRLSATTGNNLGRHATGQYHNSGCSSSGSDHSAHMYQVKNTFIDHVDEADELAQVRAAASRFLSLQPQGDLGPELFRPPPNLQKPSRRVFTTDERDVIRAPPNLTANQDAVDTVTNGAVTNVCVKNTFIEASGYDDESPRASAIRFRSMQHMAERGDAMHRDHLLDPFGFGAPDGQPFAGVANSESAAPPGLPSSTLQMVPPKSRATKCSSMRSLVSVHEEPEPAFDEETDEVDLASMFRGLIQSEIGKVAKATQKA